MDEILIVIIAIVYLIFNAIIAIKFESIAEEKGYSGYFLWCLLFGAAGRAMVIALPNRKMMSQADSVTEQPQSHDDKLPEL